MLIKPISAEDFSTIYDIYCYYIHHSTATFEYTDPDLTVFNQKLSKELTHLPGYIAFDENHQCLGYAYATRYSFEEAYDKTVKLTIYLNPKLRQKGVSKQLYDALESELKKRHIVHLIASITASNIASIKFHQKRGFEEIARLNKLGFKMGAWQDEVILQKQINPYTF